MKCAANCGVDWPSTEATTLASQRIKERFGDRAQLEYLDLSQPVVEPSSLKWQQKVRDEGLPLPLLVINGVPRILGQFDIRMLLDAVDAETEIGR